MASQIAARGSVLTILSLNVPTALSNLNYSVSDLFSADFDIA